MEEIISAIAGFIIGAIITAVALSPIVNNSQNRALSCMSAGNTVVQCQDILGITK